VRLVWRLLTAKPKLSAKEPDNELNTPLHCAAAGGHLAVLETLLGQGVDVGLKNLYGNLPVQLTVKSDCQKLLREAAAAAKDGRHYLCACSHQFCSEEGSVADVVIDRVSAPNRRPVRYSSECTLQIRQAEDALTVATKQADVPQLEEAIGAAERIGASLPILEEAVASLERLKAVIALNEATVALQEARPVRDRALVRPMHAPLQRCRETGAPASDIAAGDQLCQTAEAEATLFDLVDQCESLKMTNGEDYEEGGATQPPAADSDLAKKAEGMIAKLAAAIGAAQSVEAMAEVVDLGELLLAYLTGEHELRKALLLPKEGTSEEGTPTYTQHNGQITYSVLEDLSFRNDFLDSSLEKCIAAGTAEGIINHATKIQKELKALHKQAQIEDEERRAKEEAAAAKAAKKKKGKK